MAESLQLLSKIQNSDFISLARAITLVENELDGYKSLLEHLSFNQDIPVIGVTGPPGAGKSTLLGSIIKELVKKNKRIGVIAVDPTSPFNYGALLGDRIRLSEYYSHPNVFIRSLATRGSLGGLSEKIIEITDIMRTAPFDYLFIETVGVGQSEVEIAGLADLTIVVLVPESGDEVQTMKAGLMEIANVFVVNKSDHADADLFVKNLNALVASKAKEKEIPVIKTVALTGSGVDLVLKAIDSYDPGEGNNEKRILLTAEKVRRLIIKEKMKPFSDKELITEIKTNINHTGFNPYLLAKKISEART